ncbi:MAG: hypothetical protein JXP34_14680 [Planctomycetes bacterium]|nr:hypothetical protein [Planctomycetota bacterium]
MYDARTKPRECGSALILTLLTAILLGFMVTFFLLQGEVQARAARYRLASLRALYEGFGRLERARVAIAESDYNGEGHNLVVAEALDAADRTIPGTGVTVERMTGSDGSWFLMTARVAYEDTERIIRQAFREKDYYSSYNLFVSDDPAGVCGAPIGAIHTNETLQLYFPDGLYRHSLTAVGGAEFRAGATEENTTFAGPFNPHSERIDLDLDQYEEFSFSSIQKNALPEYSFPEDRDIKITLNGDGNVKIIEIEVYTKPAIEEQPKEVIVGYRDVNPHEVEYEVETKVLDHYETKTREVNVVDHYETVPKEKAVPVYVTVEKTRDVPIYETVTKTRIVDKQVWVVDDPTLTGGTTIGGDGGTTGHYETVQVEESYEEKVISGYTTETYTAKVFDHYDTVTVMVEEAVYATVTETYEAPVYVTLTETKTRIEYDKEPIVETQTELVYTDRQKVEDLEVPFPPNGIVYVGGDVFSIEGTVNDRLTIATKGEVRITGNITYADVDGDLAYLNGGDPSQPYEPNPDYGGRACLGLVARGDILFTRDVPDAFEVNASLLSIEGRVGIEGITLNDLGEVTAFNQFTDSFGRPVNGAFLKTSIRRLGGITTCRRPVDTVVTGGLIVSGFRRGASAFYASAIQGPPPYFLAYPTPRFFATEVVK